MAHEENTEANNHKGKPNREWLWWTLLGVFIVAAIGGMLAVDILYAPEMNNPATLPEAVGK